MYQDNFYPFYRNFQDPLFWEEERLQEREERLMRSFYPKTALELQRKVEEECDRLDYPGSFIYDEYPDKFMMEQVCRRIKGDMEMSQLRDDRRDDRRDGNLLDELIHVLLFQEMRRRRCRHGRCRRYF
ncbi:MAG: hypothetical protein Q4F24_02090 [Eubacteriales bacterium]|nr:hypothetical protein [Eubacteriales bacterium]